jgi:hypothetical protein
MGFAFAMTVLTLLCYVFLVARTTFIVQICTGLVVLTTTKNERPERVQYFGGVNYWTRPGQLQDLAVSSRPSSPHRKKGATGPWGPQFAWPLKNQCPAASQILAQKKSPLPPSR